MVATAHLYGVDQRFFGGDVLPAAVQFGFAGVDLFFVLSGFVMVHLARHGAGQPAIIPAFLFARAARIYPLWWIMLGAVTAVWLIRPDMVFASVAGNPNLLADFALFPHDRLPLLAVGWTLIHEVYFYLTFAILLLVPLRFLPLGLLVWMMAAAAGSVWFAALGLTPPAGVALLTHPLTQEFGLGAAVALLAARGERPSPALLLLAGLVWMIAGSALNLNAPAALFEDSWQRVAVYGPGWALIVWGMVGLETDHDRVPWRAMIGIGNASYALYLVHVPIFAAGSRLIARYCGPTPWDNVAAWGGLLLAAVIAALIVHHVVERPLLGGLNGLRRRWFPNGSALLPSPPLPLPPRAAR